MSPRSGDLHGDSLASAAMSNQTVDPTITDPASRTAASWSARFAALKSRGVDDTDPRAVECVAALSFHRVKRALDTEVAAGHMAQTYADTVTAGMRDQAVLQ